MDLFPIGTLSSGSNNGTISGRSYSIFEPNAGCYSNPTYTNLLTRFQNQTILSRQKADSYLNITYQYNNIFASEYEQICDFIDSKEESLTSFYVVDFSKGVLPTAIDTSSTWSPSISNTRLYDTITNQKSNYVFFYNIVSWKLGTITSISANTSITCDVDTNNYGALSDADGAVVTGNRPTMIYPTYQCFLNPGAINSFKSTKYWSNKDSNRGFLFSGNITFTTKYKV